MKIIYFLVVATFVIMWISTTSLPYWFAKKQMEFKLKFYSEIPDRKIEEIKYGDNIETEDSEDEGETSKSSMELDSKINEDELKSVRNLLDF